MLRRALTALCVLIALQGVVGLDQYETHLPTELVWVHVGLASLTWIATLWAACAAGPPPSRGARAGASVAQRRASRPETPSGDSQRYAASAGWSLLAPRARDLGLNPERPKGSRGSHSRKLGVLSSPNPTVERVVVLPSG